MSNCISKRVALWLERSVFMGKNKFDRKKWWIGACVTILAAVAVGIALWAGLKKPVKKPVEKPVGTPVRAMAVAQYPKAAKEGGVCFAD